ncbi:hypothetical protein BSPWISOXPB_2604 [uncultured Gammaproteobacteria bacterium]|nr:hypothetical protein BSPWISOXPB_2604 [uncultured Gammaproteobacteria bacterium]
MEVKTRFLVFSKNKPVYYKEHLIPFGEYTPWWFTLLRPLLPKFNMDSLFAGSNENNFTVDNIKVFSSICFEILFSTELLDRSKDANIHIHISDLGWFDNTIAIDYLLNVARMRVIETSKPMVYSVNKGHSAFIDHKGVIMSKQSISGLYMLNQTLAPQQGTTFYTKYKNTPLLGTIILLFFIFIFRRGKKSKTINSIALILAVFSIVILTNTNNNTYDANTQELSNTKTSLQQSNSSINEYQDFSGKTIIKNTLPKTLKNVESEVKAINIGLDKDLKSLEEQKAEVIAQTSDADNLKAEVQAILKLAAEAGADNKAIEKSFNTALNAPITSKPSLKLEKELTVIDRDAVNIENTMESLGVLNNNLRSQIMITINKLFILLVTIVSLSTYANLVTNLEGEAKVNNGYLSYITPLALPQGINKLSPNLSINYTQGSGSSPLGLGLNSLVYPL